jgi:hypothetical protein
LASDLIEGYVHACIDPAAREKESVGSVTARPRHCMLLEGVIK